MNCFFKLGVFLFVFFAVGNNGNIIRNGEDISTREISVPREDNNIDNNIEDGSDIPEVLNVAAVDDKNDRECVQIGSFCMNHSDCCSNACLGYMKRCVSSSG